MTAIPVGSILKDLEGREQWVAIGYRAEDDTVMVTDLQATRMCRWMASHPGFIVEYPHDHEYADACRVTLRTSMLAMASDPHMRPVALMVSDQLDHVGELHPL